MRSVGKFCGRSLKKCQLSGEKVGPSYLSLTLSHVSTSSLTYYEVASSENENSVGIKPLTLKSVLAITLSKFSWLE